MYVSTDPIDIQEYNLSRMISLSMSNSKYLPKAIPYKTRLT